MANTKISALTANTNPNGNEEFVYAYNNANGKITLDTVKSFIGGAGITTLNADANIWELNEGFYVTSHELFYKTSEKIPHATGGGVSLKQMLFVTQESNGANGYFVFNEAKISTNNYSRAAYGFSASSSDGVCNELSDKKWTLNQYHPEASTNYISPLNDYNITQIVSNINNGTQELAINTSYPPYEGITYTIYVDSIASGQDYTVTLGTGITNPLNITLPTSSTKKCVITILTTSTSTGIVTGCTMEN